MLISIYMSSIVYGRFGELSPPFYVVPPPPQRGGTIHFVHKKGGDKGGDNTFCTVKRAGQYILI